MNPLHYRQQAQESSSPLATVIIGAHQAGIFFANELLNVCCPKGVERPGSFVTFLAVAEWDRPALVLQEYLEQAAQHTTRVEHSRPDCRLVQEEHQRESLLMKHS